MFKTTFLAPATAPEKSKNYLFSIIIKKDVDDIILGCTELPLILNQHMINIPLFNTVEIHIEAALRYALNCNEL